MAIIKHPEFGEVEALYSSSSIMDERVIVSWKTEYLDCMFGTKFEESQLCSVLNTLNLIELPFELEAFGPKIYVAGGCIVRHLMGANVLKGDIDIFSRDEATIKALVNYYKSKGYVINKGKFSYTFEFKVGAVKAKCQIVFHKPKTLPETLEHFDFEHCRIAYRNGQFITTLGAPVALSQRKLHLGFIRDPSHTLIRALKYKQLGFDADDAITKLASMISHGKKEIKAAEWSKNAKLVEY